MGRLNLFQKISLTQSDLFILLVLQWKRLSLLLRRRRLLLLLLLRKRILFLLLLLLLDVLAWGKMQRVIARRPGAKGQVMARARPKRRERNEPTRCEKKLDVFSGMYEKHLSVFPYTDLLAALSIRRKTQELIFRDIQESVMELEL
jgi:hypothetical protein